ncbi:MAG TPA: trehalose-6-phosphate synthase [Pseudolabrys sp.]|nr:trehalose-6-phosphate synthase [Pseudolabrys sp.]
MDIVVSNRVARAKPGGTVTGGLAAALLPAVRKSGAVWFGASGILRRLTPDLVPLVQVESLGYGTVATVDFPEQHHAGFYEGFSNSALWPLLHERADLSCQGEGDYAAYRAVNAFLAQALAAFGGADSTYWVHDYHFLLLAHELRRRGIAGKIGFFLHTPWPARRTMTQLPQAREIAEAMLAYDLIGFQTDDDRDNFADFLVHELGAAAIGDAFKTAQGACRLATFPIGIDAREFADTAQAAGIDPEVQRLRASLNGCALIIGVDRIDYSKGLPQRFHALDRLIARHPALKRQLAMLQIAVPSRSTIEVYRALQHELASLVGAVNGRHSEIDWAPVRYLNRCYSRSVLAGFYRSAAVGLVTPLKDGMNLVAKEYIAAQNPENPGALVLSDYAGAARELDGALLVDPYDVEAIAHQIAVALSMPRAERRERWQGMMDTLLRYSVHAWFADFMQELKTPRRNVLPLASARLAATVRTGTDDQAIATHR